ncbi:ATP-grasp domain-containing protein [Streptomyces aureus]|uniref:ATP-grasp domain-containing protein n=1 Tax=Streptomyces aureus TaxID=193461 RepID=UPI00068C2E37|nr:ATP-grasp domain-containing protein [Streptomyces aureus]
MPGQSNGAPVPHLLLVCPRHDVLGKFVGLPVALTVVHRPGGDRELEASLSLDVVDADFTDADALLAVAREVHARRPVDAVLGLTELSLHPVSVVAEALGARGNPPATLALTQDKAAMRARLRDRGLGTVAHRVCAGVEEARALIRGCPAGVVLKPVDGNGGTGVHLARTEEELDRAWAWASGARTGFAWPQGESPSRVLAEEFLTGREFSVESLSAAGRHRVLAVTRKHTSGAPHFVETGHDLPAPLPPDRYRAVADAAVDALDAVGYAWGPCHTEVMLAEDGERATVVEINARQGGDQIWELVHHVTGVDLLQGAVLALAHGVLPGPATGLAGGASIRYLTPRPGRVTEVTGVAEALAVEGVIRIGELPSVGDELAPLGDSWNRAGHVVAAGPDPKSAADAADTAAALLGVRTDGRGTR